MRSYANNNKSLKAAKGMIYAAPIANATGPNIGRTDSPGANSYGINKNGAASKPNANSLTIGRSMSNDRENGTAWNSGSGATKLQAIGTADTLPKTHKNSNNAIRGTAPGMGFRSTGRNGLGVSTPGGQNGHQIFLNAELKNVITNNGQ